MASTLLTFLFSALLLLSSFSESKDATRKHATRKHAIRTDGLAYDFYCDSCPLVEDIVRSFLLDAFADDVGLAAGLLRLHFHDCFVQGCDGSVLLDGTASDPSEQASLPNLTLRPEAVTAVSRIRDQLEEACGLVVSCADITALAARESVFLSGGPFYDVPLGRRDSTTHASNATVLANLPAPFVPVSALLTAFESKNLNITDLVALSGAHTFGRGHCPSFADRLFPSQDPTLDSDFAKNLYATCPTANSPNFTTNDILTPDVFDNSYYLDLTNKKGLFTSDEGLFFDNRTSPIVQMFADDQWLFFEKFADAMVKMSQLDVLTGTEGEIRMNCAVPNSVGAGLATVVDGAAGRTLKV